VTGGAGELPYVGGRPFTRDDSAVFFGRAAEIAEVAELWRRHRLTVLFGASGVGLTSLVRAGLAPRGTDLSVDVLPVGRISQGSVFPVAALPEHNPHTLALLSTWSPDEPQTRLADLTIVDFLRKRRRYTRHPDAYGRARVLLSVIDQAEELLTGQLEGGRFSAAFIDELAEALAEISELHVLFCVRSDYKGDLVARLASSGCAVGAQFELRALSPAAALEAVRLPSANAGRPMATGVAEEIVARLTDAGDRDAGEVPPALLQGVCTRLWRAVPEHVHETTDLELHRLGGVGQLLADHCDRAVAAVSDDHGLSVEELWSWLREWFVTELGQRAFVDEGLGTTRGMPNVVVRALRDRHLLTADLRAGSRWYALQHDCLVATVRQALGRLRGRALLARFPVREESQADLLGAAEAAIASGDLALARRHAERTLRDSSAQDLRLSADAESLLGNVAYGLGDMAEAEIRYRAAAVLAETLQDTPLVARLLAAIGRTLLVRGQHREAVEYLYGAVARIPADLTVQTELAWSLWHAGQQQAAVDVLTAVLAVDGSAPEALRARGEILADLGDAEDALRDLDRVRRDRWPSSRAARALALATLRRLTAAEPEIDDAISRAPDNGPVLLYAARVAALMRDPGIAAGLALRAVNAREPAVPPHQRREALRLIEMAG
jgi:tetratricopeptide (TPR) repeat protein